MRTNIKLFDTFLICKKNIVKPVLSKRQQESQKFISDDRGSLNIVGKFPLLYI